MTRLVSQDEIPLEPRDDLPKPGDVLGGKYRVERTLGSGGMGVVFEVTHQVMTQSRFAIKWLLPLGDGNTDAVRRFRREARVCGAIRHPNVVEVYDVNLDDAGSFMVMELLQGESLQARLEREGALPYPEACRILRAALAGVSAAHALGVIHRDLKPANIFLCSAPAGMPVQPKVLDFGISRVIAMPEVADTSETRRGTRIGTPLYMAPEQMRAEECDQRTDVYALGVTLYEILSGQRAFDAVTEAELVYKILSGDVPPLKQRKPALPGALCDVVMRAFNRLPTRRFASVEEFAAALEPFCVQAAVPPRPRRSRWLAIGLGSSALAGAALLGALSLRSPKPPPAALVRPAAVSGNMPVTSVQAATAPAPAPVAESDEPRVEENKPAPAAAEKGTLLKPRRTVALRPKPAPAPEPEPPPPAAEKPSLSGHQKPVVRIGSL